MVRVTVLGSGSKGNCTVVTTSATQILVDAGLSCREIVKRMRLAGVEPEKLDAVLVTHEHQDHVQGLGVLARRFRAPVYWTQATHAAWKRWMTPRKTMSFQTWLELRRQQTAAAGVEDAASSADGVERDLTEASLELLSVSAVEELPEAQPSEPPSATEAAPGDPLLAEDLAALPAVEYFRAGLSVEIGDVRVTPFTVPHDAVDPVGFVLEVEGLRIAIATDLGYLPLNVRMHLQRTDLLILESNHDLEMLRDGPYPWAVKQRVLSRVGHLSNDAVGEYLEKEYDGSARYVVLAHLSESNNLPELARLSAERALRAKTSLLANKVLLASQNTPLESIYL